MASPPNLQAKKQEKGETRVTEYIIVELTFSKHMSFSDYSKVTRRYTAIAVQDTGQKT